LVAGGIAAGTFVACGGGERPRAEPMGQGAMGGGEPIGAGGPTGAGGSPSAGLPGELPGDRTFSGNEVLEVRLSIDAEAWFELEEHGNREEYLPATARLERSGTAVDLGPIGVRHKGAYSLHHCWDQFGGVRSHEAECAKLSLKLKFDRYDPELRFDGLKRLNLHASSGDGSMLRELIAYQTFRDFGVDAPRTLPARVFINDEPVGAFIAVEDIDGRYTAAHFPEGPNGNLYKEVWPNVRVADQDFASALETNEERSDVADVRAFAEAVARSTNETLAAELEPFAAVEPLLRYIAVDRALENWDGIMAFYSPTSPHNFFWYHDDGPEGRFHLIPWDLDATLWLFDPLMDPRDWVTVPPIPNFNEQPLDCEPRVIWEPEGPERVTPPRCDRLLDALAESAWPRLVEIGRELVVGPMAPARLSELIDGWQPLLEPLVAEDPTLELEAWRQHVAEFRAIAAAASRKFEAFLSEGLIVEPAPRVADEPAPADLLLYTSDSGLHVGGITNFEFAAPPATPEPAGVFAYADPLATFAASWSTEAPISGMADLRLDFTFTRGPAAYDEWTGVGIGCSSTDVTSSSTVVAWLAADVERSVRVRLSSGVYTSVFGGVPSEFGIDVVVGPEPRAVVIDFVEFSYPSWAKAEWSAGQGFPGTDAEARGLVLQSFEGLVFSPSASVDDAGELSAPTETGFLRVDNIYFR
jgi:spore coat protein H